MMGVVVPETCWAYKKYNKISSGMYSVLYSSDIATMHGPVSTKCACFISPLHYASSRFTFINNLNWSEFRAAHLAVHSKKVRAIGDCPHVTSHSVPLSHGTNMAGLCLLGDGIMLRAPLNVCLWLSWQLMSGVFLQEESALLWEMIVWVILRKKVHTKMGPILNGYGVMTVWNLE